MKKYFITGTGTDVGKTIVSALLCKNLRADYFKPIQTGSKEIIDRDTISKLTGVKIHKSSYCLETPASPAFAAQQENIEIDFDNITLPVTNNNLIVEGAGGCMVPINRSQTTLDLITYLDLPTIIVVKNRLGCVSDTLTTILALRTRNIEISGVILNGDDDPFANYEAIEHYGRVPVLAMIGQIDISRNGIDNYDIGNKLISKLI
ncbi:MAG: dethiobiotin synthase [Rickettsiales bacterium]|jgi:dethiobiotin synthase|nr:dethiobiotin synthase [Rickettsiales bacterium]